MNLSIDAELVTKTWTYPDGSEAEPTTGLVLLVNGIEVHQHFDPIEFQIKPARIFTAYVFTCSCGEAGCAGWFEGIKIKYKKNTVVWKVLDEDKSKLVYPHKELYFDRKEYEAVQKKVIELCHQHIESRPKYDPDEYYHSQIPGNTPEEFNEILARRIGWVNSRMEWFLPQVDYYTKRMV